MASRTSSIPGLTLTQVRAMLRDDSSNPETLGRSVGHGETVESFCLKHVFGLHMKRRAKQARMRERLAKCEHIQK